MQLGEKATEVRIKHVYNRGVDKRVIFPDASYYQRFLDILRHYLVYDYRYSLYVQRVHESDDLAILDRNMGVYQWETPPVEILAYCLLPNHYHLELKELVEGGIGIYMHRVASSFTHYFNVRNDRTGSLCEGPFKSVLVESEGQFLCLNRYIHINPIAAGLVTAENILDWPWSSLPQYLGKDKNGFCTTRDVLHYFKNVDDYLEFVLADFTEAERQSLKELAIDDDFGWFEERRNREGKLREDFMKVLRRA
jgi:putative transposase